MSANLQIQYAEFTIYFYRVREYVTCVRVGTVSSSQPLDLPGRGEDLIPRWDMLMRARYPNAGNPFTALQDSPLPSRPAPKALSWPRARSIPIVFVDLFVTRDESKQVSAERMTRFFFFDFYFYFFFFNYFLPAL